MVQVKTESYKERYDKIKKLEVEFIEFMLDDIVSAFRNGVDRPLKVGNMAYYHCNHNGKEVPAYCYLRDYLSGNGEFMPVYDRENSREFGWSNIEDVVRILDVVRDRKSRLSDIRVIEKKKIYLVRQESNVDGEILFNVVPCETLEKAKEVLKEEKETILTESFHFGGYSTEDLLEMFEIEEGDERWFINDPCDDYYEEITIIEKEIL